MYFSFLQDYFKKSINKSKAPRHPAHSICHPAVRPWDNKYILARAHMLGYLEEIRRKLLPSKVISRKVILKQRAPFEFSGLCPFHNEKTPSFTVSDDKKFFHCFGCGEHGDVIGFVSKIEGISYKEATVKLAAEAGVTLPKKTPKYDAQQDLYKIYHKIYEFTSNYYQQKLMEPEGRKALKYLEARGLSLDIIKKFRLGYAPSNNTDLINKLTASYGGDAVLSSKIVARSNGGQLYTLFKDRIMFPILDIKKQVIAFGGRAFGDIKPKYINSTDNPLFKKGNELYGLCFVLEDRKRTEPIVVVEGYMDAIAMHAAGLETAVAPLGTAFKLSQLELIWSYCPDPILLFDGDSAGKMAAKRTAYDSIPHISHDKTLKIATLENFKDPDEMLKSSGTTALKAVLNQASALSAYIFDIEYLLKPIKTPEQKSDLRKRLDALALRISDFDLKAQYRSFFRQRFNEALSSNFKVKTNKTLSSTAVIEVMEGELAHDYDLLSTLITYPELLENHEIWEKFSDLELYNDKLSKVQTELLRNFDEIANIAIGNEEKKELFAQLSGRICELFSEFCGFKLKEPSIKDIEDAGVYAIRLLKLIYIDKLESEIQMLSNHIVMQPCESDFIRLSNLKCAHENLKLELGIV